MSSQTNPQKALEIWNLTKRYRSGDTVVEAVRDVTLSIAQGEFVAVMGASGSGKSTLLHLMAGLTRPDAGTVEIGGYNINSLSDYEMTVFRRQHIGLIFQAFNLIPSLTAEENIALPALLGGRPVDTARIQQLIHKLGIERVRGRHPDSMSGGEQQRVAIGRALAGSPSLILADEPTGSLDSVNGAKLCELFRDLCRENGTTVFMVTHNPLVAIAADRFVILRDGELVAQLDRSECNSVHDLNRIYMERIGAAVEVGAQA